MSLREELEQEKITSELKGNLHQLAIVERNVYFHLLNHLYAGVATDPEIRDEIKNGKLMVLIRHTLNFYNEAGTVPSVYSCPVLKALSQDIWNKQMEQIQKQLKSDEPVIERKLICLGCHHGMSIVVPLSIDLFYCPNCNQPIKFGQKLL